MPVIKSGYKTSEFLLVLLANVLPEIGAIDVGDSRVKGLLHIITITGYVIARGLAKNNTPVAEPTPAFKTTGPEAEVPGGGFPPA